MFPRLRSLLKGGVMFEVLWQSSTRTYFSFWGAANLLGMDVCGTQNAGEFSSEAKGETFEHTIRVLAGKRVHALMLRHKEAGAAEKAARIVDKYYPGKVAVVNAGDGPGEHPTQALLDVYTIWRRLHRIDGLTVLIGGDLKNGRTCRSLAYLLSRFSGVRIIFMSPPELAMKEDILKHLDDSGTKWRVESDLKAVLPQADVVYWTRVQTNLDPELGDNPALAAQLRDAYHIGAAEADLMKEGSVLMHPMPIAGEISSEVDDHPRAVYFEQSDNGDPIRAALLLHVFGIKCPEEDQMEFHI